MILRRVIIRAAILYTQDALKVDAHRRRNAEP
jgi:hypothetical protein